MGPNVSSTKCEQQLETCGSTSLADWGQAGLTHIGKYIVELWQRSYTTVGDWDSIIIFKCNVMC